MKWFLGIVLILLAALFLESGLMAYAMYVLLGVLLVSRFLARNTLANLTATRTFRLADDERPGASYERTALVAEIGQRIAVTVTVRNQGWMVVPWVLLEDMLPKGALDLRFPRLKVKGKRLQIALLWAGGEWVLKYTCECLQRGYFQVGPLVLESGDLFGLHRRYQVKTEPGFVLVYPRLVELQGYDIASRRPIGEVRMTHRLYEDPTRIAGVRPYQPSDPLNRVHWRATARTGQLHCKVYEPSSLAGATILLDFHSSGYHARGEPYRSELAVITAASLANAVYLMGQQIGLVANGRDAADRIRPSRTRRLEAGGWRLEAGGWRLEAGGWRLEAAVKNPSSLVPPPSSLASDPSPLAPDPSPLAPDPSPLNPDQGWQFDPRTRQAARSLATMEESSERLQPLRVETRRGVEQLQRICETLARIELTDGFTFAQLVLEAVSRLPRDATVIAVLPDVPVESAIALGNLKRHGFAVTVVLIAMTEDVLEKSYARLLAENIRDVRHLPDEAHLPDLCWQQVQRSAPYELVIQE